MEKLIFRTSQAELPEDSGNDTLTVLMYCNSDDTTKVPNLYVGKKPPHKLKQLHVNIKRKRLVGRPFCEKPTHFFYLIFVIVAYCYCQWHLVHLKKF